MKLLIIGGTGLISAATTRELLAVGHAVTHVSRGISSEEFNGKICRYQGRQKGLRGFREVHRGSGQV
jgi:NAD dependent epimerase/dehydratase family enzyme